MSQMRALFSKPCAETSMPKKEKMPFVWSSAMV
jgi:hypothetical protein